MSYNLLPKETIDNQESLGNIFAEMHEAYKKRKVPMTPDETRWSISIRLASEERIDTMFEEFCNESWQLKGFFKRCDVFPIKYEKRLLIWLGVISMDFNIGGMILVGYYVQWWASKNSEKSIILKNEIEAAGALTLDEVCQRCFPFGIFNKEIVHEFWDKQKVDARPDNLIDHPKAALSFMPTENTEVIKPC